ncbi:MAG: hypothetical protein Pg6B_11160 [Candidatus Azobacteroides pseudotrichonymphae]|nr:MAG: hypothetical protein Pg6B_11160 [Candidatus Azobacteroides pseudotrichonymphae]GMO54219.1 MAG: hypothetical protein Ta2C_07110 [Candidatus Endomicrobium trichonymphae]
MYDRHKRVEATSIVDNKGKIIGFFTDGDLRRYIQNDEKILEKKCSICYDKAL